MPTSSSKAPAPASSGVIDVDLGSSDSDEDVPLPLLKKPRASASGSGSRTTGRGKGKATIKSEATTAAIKSEAAPKAGTQKWYAKYSALLTKAKLEVQKATDEIASLDTVGAIERAQLPAQQMADKVIEECANAGYGIPGATSRSAGKC